VRGGRTAYTGDTGLIHNFTIQIYRHTGIQTYMHRGRGFNTTHIQIHTYIPTNASRGARWSYAQARLTSTPTSHTASTYTICMCHNNRRRISYAVCVVSQYMVYMVYNCDYYCET
jgi:hypothetical protein